MTGLVHSICSNVVRTSYDFMNIENNNVSLPYVRNASRRGIPYHWQRLGPFLKVVEASTLHRFPTKRRDVIMVVTKK